MIWQGTSLIDATSTVADVRGDNLLFGDTTLRITSSDPTDFRATDSAGVGHRLYKQGLTVAHYCAKCATRSYDLKRTGQWRRSIVDADGTTLAFTRGLGSGDLEVDLAVDIAGMGDIAVDIVFMSWALTFVDAPMRRTMR